MEDNIHIMYLISLDFPTIRIVAKNDCSFERSIKFLQIVRNAAIAPRIEQNFTINKEFRGELK